MTEKKKFHIGILLQTTLLFVVGVIVISLLTYKVLIAASFFGVNRNMEENAAATAGDLKDYVEQYPAHEWLLRYWYENYDKLDIEYEAKHSQDSETARKCRLLTERHPGFQPEYAYESDIEALPAEDQKLYAEIVYSWLITRIDDIAKNNDLDYLFCVVTDEPYDKQMILFIAADEEHERGNQHGQIYPIGKVIETAEWQREAVRRAVNGQPSATSNEDHKYMDYYCSFGSVDGHDLVLGATSNYEKIEAAVLEYSRVFRIINALFLTALAIVALLLTTFSILRPLKKIQTNIRLYKDTKDSETVRRNLSSIGTHNELALLADDVTELTKEMDDFTVRLEKINAEKGRIETELSLANRIQMAMQPRELPEREEFEIYGSMTPAREVGGDFYDFFMIDDDHLCMIIADVSGKGVPAALFVMASKITLSLYSRMGKTPAQILTDFNTAISANNPEDMFITVWLGILDLNTGKLTAANGGHEYPILREPGLPYTPVWDKHDMVVGSLPEIQYREYELQLSPGSGLFLYTDGLVEASDKDKNMFGKDRVVAELNRDPDASAEEIIENMKKAIADFEQDAVQFDDLTMMCLIYKGRNH